MGSKVVVSVYLIFYLNFLSPGLAPVDLVKCWFSLFNVQGCVFAISNSFFLEILKMLKPNAARRFDFTCKMLASNALVNPFFPPLLKDNCTFIVPNSLAYN
ncbi:unnamed protein product [Brassica oleracea var. botrytis]